MPCQRCAWVDGFSGRVITLGGIFHSYAGQRRSGPERPASFHQNLLECNPKAKWISGGTQNSQLQKNPHGSKISKLKQSCGASRNSFRERSLSVSRAIADQTIGRFGFTHFINATYTQHQCIRLLLMARSVLFLVFRRFHGGKQRLRLFPDSRQTPLGRGPTGRTPHC